MKLGKLTILAIILTVLVVILMPLCLCTCSLSQSPTTSAPSTTAASPKPQDIPGSSEYIFRNFKSADLDGDGISEIILHDMIDEFGGLGQYKAKIYKEANSYSYDEIFNSDTYLKAHPNMDITASAIGKDTYAFENKAVGFYKEYTVKESDLEYLVDSDGSLTEHSVLSIDSFYSIEVRDIDTDGCDEIIMYQYTSLGWHANCIGECVSVFKLINGELQLISLNLDYVE